MKTRSAFLVLMLSVGGCADYLAVDAEGHHTAAPPKPSLTAPPPPTAALAPAKPDTCAAASLQYLVGKPKSEVPVPINPSGRRVYCSTCIITQDVQPGRQNVVFDSETGLVTAVKCG